MTDTQSTVPIQSSNQIQNQTLDRVQATLRYEIKLVLDHGKLAEFLLWMQKHTTAIPVYFPRTVNSLYFDNLEYQAVRDNLTGISNRKKIRLRWYNQEEKFDVSGVALELKIRNGRLGYKNTVRLPQLEPTLCKTRLGDVLPSISPMMIDEPELLEVFEEHYIPTIHLNYLREYFVDTHGIRITIDRDIRFFPVTPLSTLYDTPHTAYPLFIAEIKFDPIQKFRVAQLMRTLNMTPKRHSKYLTGMASLGQVIYI